MEWFETGTVCTATQVKASHNSAQSPGIHPDSRESLGRRPSCPEMRDKQASGALASLPPPLLSNGICSAMQCSEKAGTREGLLRSLRCPSDGCNIDKPVNPNLG